MKTIHKIKLDIKDEQRIEIFGTLELNRRVLKIAEQDGDLYMWVMVESKHNKESYRIQIKGTGFCCDNMSGEHLGTVLTKNGLVWHVYG